MQLKWIILTIMMITSCQIATAADVAAINTSAGSNAAAPANATSGSAEEGNTKAPAKTAKTTEKPLPAVAGLNMWGGAAGDYLHNQRTSGLGAMMEGGITAPMTFHFGWQIHALAGTNLQSIDGFMFWRDPTKGMFGPHLLYTKSGDFHDDLYGLHGELYSDTFTLVAEGGGTVITNGHHSNNVYYEAIIDWYALPDWKLYIGGIVAGDGTVQVGTEYAFGTKSLPGLSLFFDAGIGGHNLNYGFLGLHYYFGNACNNCKSLINRQREDMIPSTLNPINRIK